MEGYLPFLAAFRRGGFRGHPGRSGRSTAASDVSWESFRHAPLDRQMRIEAAAARANPGGGGLDRCSTPGRPRHRNCGERDPNCGGSGEGRGLPLRSIWLARWTCAAGEAAGVPPAGVGGEGDSGGRGEREWVRAWVGAAGSEGSELAAAVGIAGG